MTKEYHEFFETKKKGNYSIEEVDKKIENSNKKIIGDEINKSNNDITNKAIMWGSLSLYLSDKNFSKVEQAQFLKKFGKEKTNKILSLLKISNREVIEKKTEDAFREANKLMKKDKSFLINELVRIEKKTEGNKTKKSKVLRNLLGILK